MYELLKQMGATVLDAPAEYPYSPGYFAVYFTDPDGLKFADSNGFCGHNRNPPIEEAIKKFCNQLG